MSKLQLDYSPCTPLFKKCAQKEQCVRYNPLEIEHSYRSFRDYSVYLVPNKGCDWMIKDESIEKAQA